jgi:hypothetical protein
MFSLAVKLEDGELETLGMRMAARAEELSAGPLREDHDRYAATIPGARGGLEPRSARLYAARLLRLTPEDTSP